MTLLSRSTTWILGAFSLVSLACLVLLFAALTDLWHICGPLDVWSGPGLGKAEWRIAAVSYWTLLAFHLAWLGTALHGLLRSRESDA
jgi:hypothetical protein